MKSPSLVQPILRSAALGLLCSVPLLAGSAVLPAPLSSRAFALSEHEANKAALRQFYETIFNQHKLEMVSQFIDPKAVDHDMPQGATMEQFQEMMGMWFEAFPDFKVTVLQMAAEGDLVMCRIVQEGTFKGNLMGIAPNNKKIKLTSVDVIRFKNGKAIEHWSEWDRVSFMHQLDLKPEDLAKLGM